MSDSRELVERLKSGDEAAWRRFMRDYNGLITVVARRLGLSPSDQEEVFQITCVSAYQHIERLRDPRRLASWVHRIAYRKSLDLVTHRHRREVLSGAVEDLAPLGLSEELEPEAEKTIARYELAREIRAQLGQLDPRCRRLISVLYLRDPPWSYQRICRELDMPIGSVGPSRARCLAKLRRIIMSASKQDEIPSTSRKRDACPDTSVNPGPEGGVGGP